MFAFPFSLTYTFGRIAGNQRQGWAIFAAMATVFVIGAVVAMHSQATGNPLYPAGVDQALGNMEGKDIRFGAPLGGLWAAITTSTSTGAINAWHDSFQPIAGLVPLFNIELGEITPGGIGAGLYGMLVIGADPVRLHRRADGRPDARVPRQEGRELRDEDGDDRRPRPRRQHPRLHGARDGDRPEGLAGPLNDGPARLQRDPVRLSAARPATTARPSAG